MEDLQDIVPSSQQPARLCRKLASVEDYLLSIRQLLQTQESRAQDLEYDIQSLEDDFSSLRRETAETSKGYELGVKVFAVCAVVAFASVSASLLFSHCNVVTSVIQTYSEELYK